jgi:hypothetical protein
MTTPLHPREVMEAYAAMTGIKFRIMAPDVEKQACQFVDAAFTLEELELVIEWTRMQIRLQKGGYSDASLGWRVLFGKMGDGLPFVAFQERLGMAEAARKRGWRPALKVTAPARPAPAFEKTTQAAPAEPDADDQVKRDAMKASLKTLAQGILTYDPKP